MKRRTATTTTPATVAVPDENAAQSFCLVPALLPSELFERSSKRFSPFFSGLPVVASVLRSFSAAAFINPLAEAFPFAVGACSVPMPFLHLSAPAANVDPQRGSVASVPQGASMGSAHRHGLAERFQRLGADMMLYTLGIDACRLGADAERTQEGFDGLVALAALKRHGAAGLGQKHAAIGL